MKISVEEPLYSEVFRVLLGLQSPRPSQKEKRAWKWMNIICEQYAY